MIKVLELFGGISAPIQALNKLGIETETVDYVEFDPKVVAIRNLMYGSNYKPNSVVGYSTDKQVDLLIGGSPCQDFSTAGLGRGGKKNSGTRSSLIWEQMRILTETKPKYYIWENVKGVLNKNHIEIFNKHNEYVESIGYKVYYKVLNARNFGIPQNRDRVFVVAIRNDLTKEFNFDNLETREMIPLKEFLETPEDIWYFVKQKQKWVEDRLIGIERESNKPKNLKLLEQGNLETYTNTIITEQWKGNNQGMVLESFKTKTGIDKAKIYPTNSENYLYDIETKKPINTIPSSGRTAKILTDLKDPYFHTRPISTKEEVRTITASQSNFTHRANENKILEPLQNENLLIVKWNDKLWNVRILTEWECFALMGFKKEYVDLLKANNITRANIYKVAGNSIVVDVLEAIFKELLN